MIGRPLPVTSTVNAFGAYGSATATLLARTSAAITSGLIST